MALLLQAFQIETFATKIGIKRIAQGSTLFLFGNYVHAIATAVLSKPGVFRPIPMIGGHAVLASMLLMRYRQLNPDSMASVKKFYKHIWDLFYLEYGLYTLI
jgi:homogentisate solanesyltransferase